MLQPIKPKKFKERIEENEKKEYFIKFGEINSLKKNKILMIIEQEAETNEILKEILIYIFELRINSYFEDCQKNKFIQKSPIELLLGLNFDYFKICVLNVDNQNYGKLKNIGIIFYFSFIRCYLSYFVKLQLKNREIGDLNTFHQYLLNYSNSNLGKLISLYISKLFFLYDKKDYYLNMDLNDEQYNWKASILNKNDRVQLFSILNYENSNHLLLNLWTEIHSKDKLSPDLLKEIEISDLSFIINFCYNEISQKMNEIKIVVKSELIEKINQIKESFNFKPKINYKIKKIFETISDPEFFNKDKDIQSNLKLYFNMIKLYITSFEGYKTNLTSLIFSHSIIELIKIYFSNNCIGDSFIAIKCYYNAKEILEENNDKTEILPIYICTCGKIFLEHIEKCECSLKIKFLVFHEQDEKKKFENEYKIKNKNKLPNFKRITLSELKEIMVLPSIKEEFSFKEKLFINEEINDKNFTNIFINFIFLCQIFIEYQFEFISDEKYRIDFKQILDLEKSIEVYLETKKINFDYFYNMFIDYYIEFLKNNDYIKKKELFKDFIESTLNIENENESFKNIETNILTKLVIINEENNVKENSNVLDINLKYLLTATKYPDIDEIKTAVLSNENESLPILRTFINWEKNFDINKLLHIEKINNFINAFSEENQNLISRQTIEKDKIEKYLINYEHSEQENSSLIKKFQEFCEAYNEITNVPPYNMSMSQLVKTILNDKIQKTPIYLLYENLIKIQNDFLNKVINEFNSNKNNNKDILVQNAIEQIQKKIIIQNATKADIFEINVKNNIILSFEELYSFYSNKDIFNKYNNKINYSNYSNIKFNLSKIEKELINIILTGKKLFSEEQIFYKFYLDPYNIEEKTIKFKKFTDLYDREDLTDDEKNEVASGIESLKRIIIPNLEILINYLLKQTNYQSKQSISEIKIHSNLYLNQDFIHFFSVYKYITINKLVSLFV